MIILKLIILQIFWYLTVTFGSSYQFPILFLATLIVVINYIIYKPKITKGHYLFSIIFFIGYGFIQESLFDYLNLVEYNQKSFPLWLTALYLVFICYYGDVFNYLKDKSLLFLSGLGAIGGLITYIGGIAITPIESLTPFYYFAVAIGWAIFFPLSIRVFYEGYFWNKILDASLYYSFDLSGYLRHKKFFNEKIYFNKGLKGIITGGTSGLGLAASLKMADQGVEVIITGRSELRGSRAEKKNDLLKFFPLDMSDWNKITTFVDLIDPQDFIVLNAGGMPNKFTKNTNGVELQFASQLCGHYYLIREMNLKGKLKDGAKIVWVTSGGMYLSNLNLNIIFDNPKYDKVATYANVKRAQVTLLTYFKESFPNQIVTAMHPGWAATPGVSSSIPEFNKKMEGKLRSPLQAADTILWLLSTKNKIVSGELYFDRKRVRKNFFWFTKPNKKKIEELKRILNSW
jgi:dehydrogenase/reductase SDR family protein 12